MRNRTDQNAQLFYDVQNEKLRFYDATSMFTMGLAYFHAQLRLQTWLLLP